MSDQSRKATSFGEVVQGIDFPVFNERAIRASAGILFLFGFASWMIALTTDNYQPLRAFGMTFMIDMFLRLFVSTRWVPSLMLANLIVRPQRPEWVDAAPKKFAWSLGLGMVFASCMSLGLLNLTGIIPLILCAICISLLYIEAAFGICIGCELARRFSKNKPRLCPGDVCNYAPGKMSSKSKGSALVVIQFTLLVLLVLLPSGNNWSSPELVVLIANVLTFLAFIILLGSAINLGRSLTANPVPLEKAVLKTSGLYSIVRHPIYLAIILIAIGRSVVSESFPVLIVGLMLMVLISIKARFEDQLLLDHYEGYAEYASKVGRLFPGMGRIRTN